MSVIMTAVVSGNSDVARLLLRLEAEIDVKDKDGKTSLMIAVVNGHQNLVELLLEHNADLSIKNEVNWRNPYAAQACFTNSDGLSDRPTDHPPMLFVHRQNGPTPVGRSVAVSETHRLGSKS